MTTPPRPDELAELLAEADKFTLIRAAVGKALEERLGWQNKQTHASNLVERLARALRTLAAENEAMRGKLMVAQDGTNRLAKSKTVRRIWDMGYVAGRSCQNKTRQQMFEEDLEALTANAARNTEARDDESR